MKKRMHRDAPGRVFGNAKSLRKKMTFAEKLPEASLLTIVEAVLSDVELFASKVPEATLAEV